MWIGLAIFVSLVTAGMGQEAFTRRITPEEYARAGLGKLSAPERSELDALFRKYGPPGDKVVSAAVPQVVPRVAEATPVAPAPAPAAAPAPDPVETKAPAPGVVVAEEPKAPGGFFRKTKRAPAAPKPKVEAIETEIDGSFTGWEEMTVWTMKDGSIWRVDNRPRPYFMNRVANPKVRIYPAVLNGYWLEIPAFNIRVRVQRLK